MEDGGAITQLLRAAREGNEDAKERVITSTYQELRRLARNYMARERRDHTLQPTALVNEACIRLLGQNEVDWADRQHFLACAAQQMRRVLLDHARAHAAQKRGGDKVRVTTQELEAPGSLSSIEIIALDQALTALSEVDPRQARIVELRYFAGLTAEEIAEVLNVGIRTVRRDWVHARALLVRHLGRGAAAHGTTA